MRVVQDSRAILITRHPCACIASTLRGEAQKKFSSAVAASEDYGIVKIFVETAGRSRGLSFEHLRDAHPVERMAWIWVLSNEKAVEETKDRERCLPVRYEDFCSDPVAKTKETFSFMGLPWTEQTAQFIEASTLAVKPGRFDRLTQGSSRFYGIFRDPVGAANKWKSEMKTESKLRIGDKYKVSLKDRQPLCDESEFDEYQEDDDNKTDIELGHKPGAVSKSDKVRIAR